MIIKDQNDITKAVLAEIARAPSPRFREIMSAAVTHLHGFARDAQLTEAEFHQMCQY
ncbi:MAG TPA: catechol 1,2-dioxygenase, partial [Pusillimonas sp.]|nr:catechol 1,2-dioxygenase [Pusillimonas sp.]